MPNFTRPLILVIVATIKDAANIAMRNRVDPSGDATFSVGLVPAGSPPGTPPTHYWAAGVWTVDLDTRIRQRLQAQVDAVPQRAWVFVHRQPEQTQTTLRKSPDEVLATLGLERARPLLP
ncbi:MAG TPA: hypothetical protein VEI97_20830 [bacterium]|nr:hypothetical protein [bacterium]